MTTALPGRPTPLGATYDGVGVNVAVRSASATSVEVCLFDDSGQERRVRLPARTGDVWHGLLPGVGPGQRYGLRADGPYDPTAGALHDPAKLLLDPYARQVEGTFRLDDAALTTSYGCDSSPFVPRSVVQHDDFEWGADAPPRTPWAQTVIYELHVKGFTALHPGVPEALRGTYAGLAHPAAVQHLVDLGVTAVELLPVQAFVSEPHLQRRGLTNYWGYATVGFLAPHPAYAATADPVTEFKAMVRALHAAGLEVLLDVVYNHTGEGDATGPTLCHRGLDNAGYYWLDPQDRSRYQDVTGTGATLDLRSPGTLALVTDSLRHWVQELHVDGFRFDLASALTRGGQGAELTSSFLDVIAQDPVLSSVKLVAEPWDLGPGGYLVGRFPPPWASWNDRFRDAVRDAWRGQAHGVRELAYRLTGSSDLFGGPGRTPSSSVNLVTAHDGFTLHDLTAYDVKHNEANGEGGRDGEAHNRSWNCGVEGPTDDPQIDALRRRQARNALTTLLLSTGTPMLTMGDELRRTQRGNNNAYCQDNDLSWLSWQPAAGTQDLLAWTTRLLELRRNHPALRQGAFFVGRRNGDADVAWYAEDGRELTDDDWADAHRRTLVMLLSGTALRDVDAAGTTLTDDSFLLALHTGGEPIEVAVPQAPAGARWWQLLDTRDERPGKETALTTGTLTMLGRSAVLLRARRP